MRCYTPGMTERKRGWLKGEVARRFTLYLPEDVFEELRQRCFEARMEMSQFVTQAVKTALKRRQG